ncbi:MAG: hypothetical protein QNJ16_11935 [Rhodobacter sp.]|nr:hypothetical protein [Rhodobacter sp.]
MNRFGPSRKELVFRLYFALLGLILVAVALVYRGAPSAAALFEVGVIAGGFFGGTAIWSAWRLLRRDR